MFERFSEGARRVLVLAQEEARLARHSVVGTGHLIVGLLRDGQDCAAGLGGDRRGARLDDVAAKALAAAGVDLECARIAVDAASSRGGGDGPTRSVPFTAMAKNALEVAAAWASQFGDEVRPAHLLLALVDEPDHTVWAVLQGCRVDLGVLRARLLTALGVGEGAWVELPARKRIMAWVRRPDRVIPPDFSTLPPGFEAQLASRVEALPLRRIRIYEDYWAVTWNEDRFVRRLARRHRLDKTATMSLTVWHGNLVRGRLDAVAPHLFPKHGGDSAPSGIIIEGLGPAWGTSWLRRRRLIVGLPSWLSNRQVSWKAAVLRWTHQQ